MSNLTKVTEKNVIANGAIYKLSYYLSTEDDKCGIKIECEKTDNNLKLLFKDSQTVMLENENSNYVTELIHMLSNNIVFPNTLKDIIEDMVTN